MKKTTIGMVLLCAILLGSCTKEAEMKNEALPQNTETTMDAFKPMTFEQTRAWWAKCWVAMWPSASNRRAAMCGYSSTMPTLCANTTCGERQSYHPFRCWESKSQKRRYRTINPDRCMPDRP